MATKERTNEEIQNQLTAAQNALKAFRAERPAPAEGATDPNTREDGVYVPMEGDVLIFTLPEDGNVSNLFARQTIQARQNGGKGGYFEVINTSAGPVTTTALFGNRNKQLAGTNRDARVDSFINALVAKGEISVKCTSLRILPSIRADRNATRVYMWEWSL